MHPLNIAVFLWACGVALHAKNIRYRLRWLSMENTNPRHRTYGDRADPVTHGQGEALYLWGMGMFCGLNALVLGPNGSDWQRRLLRSSRKRVCGR